MFVIFVEISFLINVFVECCKAYDIDGDGVYEVRFIKTSNEFLKTTDAKIQILNLIPFGLLGKIEGGEWLRILYIFKIYRIKISMSVFRYKKYSELFLVFNKNKLRMSGYEEPLYYDQELQQDETD